MPEPRTSQQFIDSADLKYQWAQTLARPIDEATQALLACITGGGKLMVCGNGASGALAQYLVALLVGGLERARPELPALALGADAATLTAVARRGEYADVFAAQVRALGNPGDALLLLSTNGNTVNLVRAAQASGYQPELLLAVEAVNQRQKQVLFDKIHKHFGGDLRGRCFALWGLAFKPKTDDMREAPSRVLMEALWAAGASVQAYDPAAMPEARRLYGDRSDLRFCERPAQALQGADALVIVTEWSVFRSPDFEVIKAKLRNPVIFDGRNLYDPVALQEMGFAYYPIGRKAGAAG